MNVPIIGASSAHAITGSDAPSVEELRDPAKHWGLVSCGSAKYLGRIGAADPELGLVRIDDPFLYISAPNATRDGHQVRINFVRQVLPVEGWGGTSKIAVRPDAIALLEDLGKAECANLRELLVGAWEGRKHLRRLDENIERTK